MHTALRAALDVSRCAWVNTVFTPLLEHKGYNKRIRRRAGKWTVRSNCFVPSVLMARAGRLVCITEINMKLWFCPSFFIALSPHSLDLQRWRTRAVLPSFFSFSLFDYFVCLSLLGVDEMIDKHILRSAPNTADAKIAETQYLFQLNQKKIELNRLLQEHRAMRQDVEAYLLMKKKEQTIKGQQMNEREWSWWWWSSWWDRRWW